MVKKHFYQAQVDGLAFLLLGASLLVFFHRALPSDKVLSAADSLFTTPVFTELAPSDFEYPSNPLLFDQVYQFQPWRYLTWSSMRAGELPTWNPYSLSGSPLIATQQSAVFYPINLILTLVQFTRTFLWSAVIRLWIAGISTFLLLRRYRLHFVPAMIGAVSFMYCGFLIVWLGHPHTNVAIWLPALILVGENLVSSENRQQAVRALAVLGLLIGIQFTGGHIETSLQILLAFAVYYLVRWIQSHKSSPMNPRRNFTVLFLPLISLLIGLAIAAAQLLPFLEWLSISAELQSRAAESVKLINPDFLKHIASLPLLIYPDIFNNPTYNYPYWSFLLNWSNYNELILYMGALSFVLAVIAVIMRNSETGEKRNLIWTWAFIGLLCLALSFRIPLFDLLNHLPIMDLNAPARFRLIIAFSLCLLAGFGSQQLFHGELPQRLTARKYFMRGLLVVIVFGLLMMIASNIVLPQINSKLRDYAISQLEESYYSADRVTAIEIYYAEVDQMIAGLNAAFRPTNWKLYAPMWLAIITFSLLSLAWRCRHYERWAGVILFCLVFIDLYIFGSHYNPVIPVESFYPTPPTQSYLSTDKSLFRALYLRQDLIPDSQVFSGIADVRGLDFPTIYQNQYLNLIPERIPWLGYGAIFSGAESPLLRVLNLKYIISARSTDLPHSSNSGNTLELDGIYVMTLGDPQPRAFMVYEAVRAENDAEAKALIAELPEMIFKRVIISAEGNAQPLISAGARPEPAISNATPVIYKATYSKWQVSTSRPGYLFLSDSYYPGWKALIDGQPVPIARANIAFRAVLVPAGDHLIEFCFEPLSISIGLIVSIIGLALATVMLTATFFSKVDNFKHKAKI